MVSAKEKRIVQRLEQIKERAAEENARQQTRAGVTMGDLAEEAAQLGLELAGLKKEKG